MVRKLPKTAVLYPEYATTFSGLFIYLKTVQSSYPPLYTTNIITETPRLQHNFDERPHHCRAVGFYGGQ